MGGVNSNKPPDPTRVPFETESIHGNRPAFRATGKGLMVDKPDNPGVLVNAKNANATLTTIIAPGDNPENAVTHYLFVDGIKTSYKLSGTTAQSQDARSFYPRNLIQANLIITGTLPNQYEFDKLVVFVNKHQKQIVTQTDVPFGGGIVQVKGLHFTYHRPGNSQNTYEHGPRLWGVQYTIAIEDIQAGHERFKFAPAYTLTCKILDDHHYGLNEGESAIVKSLELDFDYQRVFGLYGHPLMSPAQREEVNFSLENNTQTKKAIGTGGGGGGDFSPGEIPSEFHAAIAAAAQPLSKPEQGNPIKAQMVAKYPGKVIPPDPGKQYAGGMKQGGPGSGAEKWIHQADEHYNGKHVHVKYRNPPQAGNEIVVPL